MLADFVPRIATALGVPDVWAVEGIDVAGGDPVDESVVTAGLDLHTSIARYRSGDLTLFLISGRHLAGTEERGRHERVLAQRGGVTVCEVLVCTSLRRRLARDDVDLDQAHVRITHGLDSMLGAVLTELIAALRARPPVEVAPDADLEGVDLGRGTPNGGGTGRAVVDWVIQPTTAASIRELFGLYVERCFEQFGLGAVPALETTTTRIDSDAHDGSFSLLARSAAATTDRRVRLALSTVESFRNEDDIDHVSVNLDMRTDTDRLRIVASGRSGAGCTQLRLHRPTSKQAVEALWATFGPVVQQAPMETVTS